MENAVFCAAIGVASGTVSSCQTLTPTPQSATAVTTPTPAPLPAPQKAAPSVAVRSELATWSWPGAKSQTTARGVTHWLATQKDGTTCDLMRFDFAANPQLEFGLYSQDQDDLKPWDNVVEWWPMGIGQATRHLNQSGKGSIVAAWNGPFSGYYHGKKPGRAFHLAPVVIDGAVHHNTGNHRWTLGWNNTPTGPKLQMVHLAKRPQLEKFDFASETVQNLIQGGKSLPIRAFPKPGEAFPKPPVASTPREAEHIPFFDHAKFSRASLAWSKDRRQLWMILVREPKGEGTSINKLLSGQTQSGGWNVTDLQRFWQAFAARGLVWNAINSEVGDVGQLAFRFQNSKL